MASMVMHTHAFYQLGLRALLSCFLLMTATAFNQFINQLHVFPARVKSKAGDLAAL
jgi:hypothetical protein